MILSALPNYWRARAVDLEPFSPSAAQAFREAAELLEQTLGRSDEAVTLKDASRLGGYSVDALQRMVAAGRIPNAGRKGKPRIRLGDIPKKPGCYGHTLQNSNLPVTLQATAVVASVIARENPR